MTNQIEAVVDAVFAMSDSFHDEICQLAVGDFANGFNDILLLRVDCRGRACLPADFKTRIKNVDGNDFSSAQVSERCVE